MRIFSTTIAAATLSFGMSHAAFAKPPVEAYADLPLVSSVSISPSGRYFAVIQGTGDQSALTVFDSTNNQRVGGIPSGKANLNQVRWFSDDRMLVFAGRTQKERFSGQDIIYTECSMFAMNRDGGSPISLPCALLSMKGPTPDTILMTSYKFGRQEGSARLTQRRGGSNVYAVNVNTGASELFEAGPRNTVDWEADATGALRLRIELDRTKTTVFARLGNSKEWTEITQGRIFGYEDQEGGETVDAGQLQIQGFADDPNIAIVQQRIGDKEIVASYDLAARKMGQTLLSDPKYDVAGTISNRFGKVIGAAIARGDVEYVYFDSAVASALRELKANFPGHTVSITSISDDSKKMIASIEGPQAPGGAYQYIDFEKGDGFTIGRSHPKLSQADIGNVSYITYKARDGQEISAYLTLPPGSSGKNLPAIVMPHGGPQARDYPGFDWWSQFLANRGYAVLQPQFRGSEGYGKAFADAGKQQWGLRMQDDVTDGVKAMIAQGVFDPKRICIKGWSYGGYAALAGATLTPELYRCVIAGAGVGDLLQILTEERETAGGGRYQELRYWKKHIGNPATDREKIAAVSPARHAKNVQAPVLLIHGDRDFTVYISQSETMEKALKEAGKEVQFIRLEGEDHYLRFGSARAKVLKASEEFLLKHNPP